MYCLPKNGSAHPARPGYKRKPSAVFDVGSFTHSVFSLNLTYSFYMRQRKRPEIYPAFLSGIVNRCLLIQDIALARNDIIAAAPVDFHVFDTVQITRGAAIVRDQ